MVNAAQTEGILGTRPTQGVFTSIRFMSVNVKSVQIYALNANAQVRVCTDKELPNDATECL